MSPHPETTKTRSPAQPCSLFIRTDRKVEGSCQNRTIPILLLAPSPLPRSFFFSSSVHRHLLVKGELAPGAKVHDASPSLLRPPSPGFCPRPLVRGFWIPIARQSAATHARYHVLQGLGGDVCRRASVRQRASNLFQRYCCISRSGHATRVKHAGPRV